MKFNSFSQIFEFLTENPDSHVNGSEKYLNTSEAIKIFVNNTDLTKSNNNIDFGEFGYINFGYFSMGAISSLDLFGIDELIIFCLYKRFKDNVEKAVDFGANIGLHSIAMGRLGWIVNSFEPDENHFNKLSQNLNDNNLVGLINPQKKAVWINDKGVKFTRVLGNTTGNHINGMKSPYGELDHIFVETVKFEDEIKDVDFIKLDVEGAEGDLFESLNHCKNISEDLNIILEITEKSRTPIFEFATKYNLNLFCQKLGWKPAKEINDLPKSHKDGSVFCSHNNPF